MIVLQLAQYPISWFITAGDVNQELRMSRQKFREVHRVQGFNLFDVSESNIYCIRIAIPRYVFAVSKKINLGPATRNIMVDLEKLKAIGHDNRQVGGIDEFPNRSCNEGSGIIKASGNSC